MTKVTSDTTPSNWEKVDGSSEGSFMCKSTAFEYQEVDT